MTAYAITFIQLDTAVSKRKFKLNNLGVRRLLFLHLYLYHVYPGTLGDPCDVDSDCYDAVVDTICRSSTCGCADGFYLHNSTACQKSEYPLKPMAKLGITLKLHIHRYPTTAILENNSNSECFGMSKI